MASTNSLNFPNLFDVSRNCVSVATDSQSVVNRTRLLMLTEPTELYNSPDFGVGLRKYLWQYNNSNQKAIITKRIVDQLRLHEPCVDADKTTVTDGLLFTGTDANQIGQEYNQLKLTVSLVTVFGDTVEVKLNDN